MTAPHNLYFHVPFCVSKCNYCAFYSAACANPDWDRYANNIISEIEHWHNKLGRIDIPTIFFGGGTPSLMPTDCFARIMQTVREKFNILPDCEITLESNPGTVDAQKLAEFQKIGMNRLSVGIQSLNDDVLHFMGRKHSVRQAIQLLEDAKQLGLRISADFIYGLPDQTTQDVTDLCKQINKLGLQHCSMYELSIEYGTPFSKMDLNMPDNETMAEMYLTIKKTLNLPRYEVSNYARPGQECQHNLNIWAGQPYIGIGKGAAGRVLIDDTWYEQMGNGALFKQMTNNERAVEKVILGLRTTGGVEIAKDILPIISPQYINENPDLLLIKDGKLITTEKGMLILNELLLNLVK